MGLSPLLSLEFFLYSIILAFFSFISISIGYSLRRDIPGTITGVIASLILLSFLDGETSTEIQAILLPLTYIAGYIAGRKAMENRVETSLFRGDIYKSFLYLLCFLGIANISLLLLILLQSGVLYSHLFQGDLMDKLNQAMEITFILTPLILAVGVIILLKREDSE